jgi:RHS repeat-associated protein
LHYLTSIFLTLLFFLIGGNFAVAKNQVSSASLGVLCASKFKKEFLTADHTDTTDKSELDRQVAKNAKVFKTSLEPVLRESTSLHAFLISASLRDLCALAVNSSSTRTTTGPVATIIPSQTQSFTVNDRLTTDTYDSNGNTTSSLITDHGSLGTNASDVYSFDNRLIRRTTPDGKTIDLTYNPDGHRLSKFITQNGLTQRLVHYLTDANNPTGYAQVIEEKDPLEASNNQLNKVHLYGHDLISSLITDHSALITEPIFYTYDGLGSVRSITNESGDLQETYDYDAYGTLIGLNKRNNTTGLLESSNLSSTIPNLQSDYLFTGEQWDPDLGMYFLRARYLNTNTGRFHSQDSYEGRNGEPLTLHKYLYANGNPAMFTDPSGEFSLLGAQQAVLGGLISLSRLVPSSGFGLVIQQAINRVALYVLSNAIRIEIGIALGQLALGLADLALETLSTNLEPVPETAVGPWVERKLGANATGYERIDDIRDGTVTSIKTFSNENAQRLLRNVTEEAESLARRKTVQSRPGFGMSPIDMSKVSKAVIYVVPENRTYLISDPSLRASLRELSLRLKVTVQVLPLRGWKVK